MPGTHDARQRLLGATVELLREGGLAAASPAAIATRAGAGKMSLYRHFAGKDEAVAEALAARDAAHREWLLGDEPDPLAVFDRVAERADRDGYSGCAWANSRLEAHDAAHPVAAAARAHKAAMAAGLAAKLGAAGHPAPEATGRALLMLLDGAIVHAVLAGSGEPVREARAAAARLLS
jgi:AcrR family transcriptional regulator